MSKDQKPSGPKLGESHASAMFRQGLRELRGSLYPESNVAQPPEYGLYGTQTPGEVAEARRAEPSRDEEPIQPPLSNPPLPDIQPSRGSCPAPSHRRDHPETNRHFWSSRRWYRSRPGHRDGSRPNCSPRRSASGSRITNTR